MRPLPELVYAHIFSFINPCGSLHFLYIRDLYIQRCLHYQLPPLLHISALISMNDTGTLEKLKDLVLNFKFRETVRLAVAQFGSIETIQWFLSNGIISWDTNILILLARRGELFSIKLLLSQGSRFSPQIIFNAGRFGRENIIHWADFLFSLEGCLDNFPFNEKIISTFLEFTTFGNQLNVILWMKDNNCSQMLRNADKMIFGAVKGGHIKMLEWIKSNLPSELFIRERKRFRCVINAAQNKNITLLKWLHHNNFELQHRVYTQAAAFSGNLEVLQYLRDIYPPCPWSYQVCNIAVKQGNMEMLQWAMRQGCPWKKKHMLHIVSSKDFLEEPR